ncbi:MAG: tagaturonate reductase, partial [Paenibacillus macerans]|nr:tagaturonate reductase [Paenibacillus macerans]
MNRLTQAMAPGRAVRPAKVLQFGEGNFLRAFVDWQIDIMNKKTGFNGNVVIVQPLPAGLAEALNEQDGLYTVYLEGMKEGRPVREHSLIESVARGINPYSEYEAYAKLAENPDLRFIISNTTEAGIAFAPADRLCLLYTS